MVPKAEAWLRCYHALQERVPKGKECPKGGHYLAIILPKPFIDFGLGIAQLNSSAQEGANAEIIRMLINMIDTSHNPVGIQFMRGYNPRLDLVYIAYM